jgi:hypothetical protein
VRERERERESGVTEPKGLIIMRSAVVVIIPDIFSMRHEETESGRIWSGNV